MDYLQGAPEKKTMVSVQTTSPGNWLSVYGPTNACIHITQKEAITLVIYFLGKGNDRSWLTCRYGQVVRRSEPPLS